MIVRSKRSLKASSQGINLAKQAVLAFPTKVDLAADLEMSRATLQKFFAGKPVGRENFHHICQKLQLSWQEVADLSENHTTKLAETSINDDNINDLVAEVKAKGYASIQQRCGIMRVLDMSQPVELDDIYTNVNVLEKIIGRRRLGVADLLQVCVADDFDRPGLGQIIQSRVSGLEALKNHPKLFVLGKPGAGKTTFLKYLAVQCNSGKLEADKVPIFITLKDFAEDENCLHLLDYVTEQFIGYGVNKVEAAEEILSQGKGLILLDGLDEVREIDCYRVLQEVHIFSEKFHNNYFVITCRIATHEYTLEQFTEVEIADFDQEQVAKFAQNWFAQKEPSKTRKFLGKLHKNPPIQEIATNPLLLTMLCLMFEEIADFPANSSELYQEGLHLLLRKWDAKRNIERSQIYKKLSLQHKEDLLSQIALLTFKRGDYFFKQNELEQHIADYICNLPNVSTETEVLQLDSEAVVKSIEAQHGLLVERARGIYSFSHLSFQEYFAAKEIVSSSNPQVLETTLRDLVSNITEKRWREVFLLTVGMLRNADYLLLMLKDQIDALVADNKKLQNFIKWIDNKSHAVSSKHKLNKVRAFYLDLDIARKQNSVGGTLDLARLIDNKFTRELCPDLALDLALDRALTLNYILDFASQPVRVFKNVLDRTKQRSHNVNRELKQAIVQLEKQTPFTDTNEKFKQWWVVNNHDWTEELRATIVSHRDFGYNWDFNHQEWERLKQYYEANKLLVSCLGTNSYMSRSVRQTIEDTLVLITTPEN
ncbi:NACHT domain-containing protein [Synechocystis sp. PCC 7509]|uniref:NACHT domain-containing protein n=1 Tax=Synechocystis sp. PCC 7509 TaxID=927677 RepID=UPI0002ABC57B|nr:NACHT domain-containing NTPase [Synechocystis sp. PCC 7509]